MFVLYFPLRNSDVSPCDHNQVLCVLKSILSFFFFKIHTIGGGTFLISCDLSVLIPTPKTHQQQKKLHMKSSIEAVLEFCLLKNVCVCRRWWMYWCNIAQGQGWLSSYLDATLTPFFTPNDLLALTCCIVLSWFWKLEAAHLFFLSTGSNFILTPVLLLRCCFDI